MDSNRETKAPPSFLLPEPRQERPFAPAARRRMRRRFLPALAATTALATTIWLVDGAVCPTPAGAQQIVVGSGQSTAINDGSVSSVLAENGGEAALTNTAVTSPDNGIHGLHATGAGSRIEAVGGSVATSGSAARGAFADGGAHISLSGVPVVTTGNGSDGVYADGAGTTLDVTGGSISTAGDAAFGAVAIFGGMVHVTGTTITTAGTGSYGLAAGEATLEADGVSVTTTGANSYGVVASNNASLLLSNSTVTTTGAGASGLVLGGRATATNSMTVSGSQVRTVDPSAAAIEVLGGGSNSLALTGSLVEAAGGAGVLLHVADLNTIPTGNTDIDAASSRLLGNILIDNGTVSLSLRDASSLAGAALAGSGGAVLDRLSIDATSRWDMTASSVLNNLDNAGTIAFAAPGSGGAFNTLTVQGSYVGNGGTVALNTALGDDSSETDRLVVAGSTSGLTNVVVTNRGGLGAYTVQGIKVIEVGGASDGDFLLSGDYVIGGKNAVVGGAYAYTLEQNGLADPTDGDWYLRSRLGDAPLYQAGVPAYEAYPQALLALNGFSTLQQRVGNRVWGQGTAASAAGMPTDAGSGVWTRVEASHSMFDPAVSTSLSRSDTDVFKMQAGVDGAVSDTAAGLLVGGLSAHYVHGRTDVSSVYGDGNIDADGYGVAGTLTWYGANGFYADGQAQVTVYDSDLTSDLAGGLVSGNDGLGWAVSAEVGQRFAAAPGWTLTPQAQLVYSAVTFDSFSDRFGAPVEIDNGDSLRGRLGLSVDHESAWRDEAGRTSRLHAYAIANLYNEFLDGTRVDVAGTGFANREDRLWGGIGFGGSLSWADGKYALYGQGTLDTSLSDFGDSYVLAGTAGLRISF